MGFRVIIYKQSLSKATVAWRPLRGAAGRLCSSAEPAMVSLALDAPAYPQKERGGGRV